MAIVWQKLVFYSLSWFIVLKSRLFILMLLRMQTYYMTDVLFVADVFVGICDVIELCTLVRADRVIVFPIPLDKGLFFLEKGALSGIF